MPESDLDLLTRAALAAGEIAQAYRARGPQVVTEKPGGAGPVTEADLAVNRMLEDVLRSARPDHGWLSEESADDPARLRTRHCFIIDPIDGTRAFIAGDTGFSHSLAIAQGGTVVAAVVHLPARGLTYAAAAGQPATLNGAPIRASAARLESGASVLAARPALEAAQWPGGVPPLTRAFRTSLAWRLCLVAEGRFDAMVTLRDTWEWDVAAGMLIAAQAGAVVSDAAGAGLRFNAPHPQTAGIMAAPPALHRQLIGRRTAIAPHPDPTP